MEHYLTVGSVVIIKGEEANPYMIMGYLPELKSEGKTYDYLAVPYPLGMLDEHSAAAFNQSDIDKVLYKGYIDEEGAALTDVLTGIAKGLGEAVKQE